LGGLLDAGGLHLEGDPAHRREDRVNRDDADRVARLVAVGRDVAATLRHGDVDGQAGRLVQRGDVELGVEDVDVAVGVDVLGGDVIKALLVEAQGDRLVAVADEDQVLQVEDDVGDVLGDPGDRVELVERVVEAQLGDRRAGDGRQERAAQGVAEGVTEAGLQRADGELLTVAFLFADRLDGRALDDEHVLLPRASAAAGGGDYVEYSSTVSCARTGTSICSRSGSSRTVTDLPPSPWSSQAGTRTSSVSRLCWMTIIDWAFSRRETTSPFLTR